MAAVRKKKKNIQAISKELHVETAFAKSQLAQSWVKPDSFVPLKKWIEKGTPKDLPGLASSAISIRTYPLNEAAAQLIGYVGEVSADDIKKNPALAAGDVIGKTGLERYFDKQLRGKNGGTIKIVNSQTKKRGSASTSSQSRWEANQIDDRCCYPAKSFRQLRERNWTSYDDQSEER